MEPVAKVGRDFLRSGLSVSGPARLQPRKIAARQEAFFGRKLPGR